ncbi:MAG: DNA-processing protein DprA [Actinomycetes bacterium]
MTGDEKARLILISAIEGNSKYWANEVLRYGAEEVVDRLERNFYHGGRHSGEKIGDRVRSVNSEELIETLQEGFLLTPSSEDWPVALNDLIAPPFALIGLGEREILPTLNQSIGIVGTRNPTHYGSRIASDFAASLCDRGWAIVSGGAYGIDSAAHRGALAVEGETVAVLGGGVRSIFPSGNDRLFTEIATHGLLLSEVLPTVPAVPHRFLIRNRLIAALSRGLLVVEAAHRSGSLRTARDAAELLRPVMAIPGPINTPTSEGCHRLINERRAELVSSVDEIMELVAPL